MQATYQFSAVTDNGKVIIGCDVTTADQDFCSPIPSAATMDEAKATCQALASQHGVELIWTERKVGFASNPRIRCTSQKFVAETR